MQKKILQSQDIKLMHHMMMLVGVIMVVMTLVGAIILTAIATG
ncbi:hypothetical protein [Rhizobium sp. P38BS-XIX]|nr:hypothetical protein [Rhizobium sp. P38BS-XIX]